MISMLRNMKFLIFSSLYNKLVIFDVIVLYFLLLHLCYFVILI